MAARQPRIGLASNPGSQNEAKHHASRTAFENSEVPTNRRTGIQPNPSPPAPALDMPPRPPSQTKWNTNLQLTKKANTVFEHRPKMEEGASELFVSRKERKEGNQGHEMPQESVTWEQGEQKKHETTKNKEKMEERKDKEADEDEDEDDLLYK